MTTIISIERIHREATEAALAGTPLDAACPYPFYSPEGMAFKEAYATERARLDRQSQAVDQGVNT